MLSSFFAIQDFLANGRDEQKLKDIEQAKRDNEETDRQLLEWTWMRWEIPF